MKAAGVGDASASQFEESLGEAAAARDASSAENDVLRQRLQHERRRLWVAGTVLALLVVFYAAPQSVVDTLTMAAGVLCGAVGSHVAALAAGGLASTWWKRAKAK